MGLKTSIFVVVLVSICVGGWLAWDFARSPNSYLAVYSVIAMWVAAAFFLLAGFVFLLPKRTRRFGLACCGSATLVVGCFLLSAKTFEALGFVAWKGEQMERIGPEVRADLVIYFGPKTADEDIEAFHAEVLTEAHPSGVGREFRFGIQSYLRLLPLDGHEGIALTLSPSASQEERTHLKSAVQAWPTVYVVLENVAPSEIKSLPDKPDSPK